MITGNESAFARPASKNTYTTLEATTGLTIYQQFAAMAMQGILANSVTANNNDMDTIVAISVSAAQKLIRELNNRPYAEH